MAETKAVILAMQINRFCRIECVEKRCCTAPADSSTRVHRPCR